MSRAPRFSEEWLEGYRMRLGLAQEREKGAAGASRAPTHSDVPPDPAEGRKGRSRAPGRKMTRTEERYNREVLGGAGRYEPVTFRLTGGCRYTPDFMTVEGGVPTFHEVKGAYRLGSEGRAWTAFTEAAAQFPFFRWVWAAAKPGGRGWTVKRRAGGDGAGGDAPAPQDKGGGA